MNSKKNVFKCKKENPIIIDISNDLILEKIFEENNKRNYFWPIDVIFAIFKVVNLDDTQRAFITKHKDFTKEFFQDLLENKYTKNIFSKTSNGNEMINFTPKFYSDLCNIEYAKILKSFKSTEFITFFKEKYDISLNKKKVFNNLFKDIENDYLMYLNHVNLNNSKPINLQISSTKNNKRKFEERNCKISKNLDVEISQMDISGSQVEFSQFPSQDFIPSDEKRKRNMDININNKITLNSLQHHRPQAKNQQINNQSKPKLNTDTFNDNPKPTNPPKSGSNFNENSIPNQIPQSKQSFSENYFESLKTPDIKQIRQNKTENITQELIQTVEDAYRQKIEDEEYFKLLISFVDDLHSLYPHIRKIKIYQIIIIPEVGLDLDKILEALDLNKEI